MTSRSETIPYAFEPTDAPGNDRPSTGPEDLAAGNPILSPAQQLDQLASFLQVHYPEIWGAVMGPGLDTQEETEQAVARLADVLPHTSQLVLGGALDHSMPGVAFTAQGPAMIELSDRAVMFMPTCADERTMPARCVLSVHGGPGWHGSGVELDVWWRPTAAAIAQLAGVPVVDVDYRLPAHQVADPSRPKGWSVQVRPHGVAEAVQDLRDALRTGVDTLATRVPHIAAGDVAWSLLAFGSGTGLALRTGVSWERVVAQHARWDAYGDPQPDGVPRPGDAAGKPLAGAKVLLQVGSRDTVATAVEESQRWAVDAGAAQVEVAQYEAFHVVSTPEQARRHAEDAAAFLR